MIYLAFNKPYGVLSQFRSSSEPPTPGAAVRLFREKPGRLSLKNFGFPAGVYPCGRLDQDSEGLLILSDDGKFNQRITHPSFKKPKNYRVQLERLITDEALEKLGKGVLLNDGPTLPAKAVKLEAPLLEPRVPPVRFRKTVPTSWASITITEGRNRQVRRMFACVGFPVLRLLRYSVGPVTLEGLAQGASRPLTAEELKYFLK